MRLEEYDTESRVGILPNGHDSFTNWTPSRHTAENLPVLSLIRVKLIC